MAAQRHSRKRKQVALLSFDKAKELLASVDIDNPAKGEHDMRTVLTALKELVEEVGMEPPRKVGKSDNIQASSIKDVKSAVKLFGLEYNSGLQAYAWEMPVDQPTVEVAKWLGTVLTELRSSTFWHTELAEALHRTSIDLMLFERLSAYQHEVAASNLCLKAERSITAECQETGQFVCGDVDYALGYEPGYPTTSGPQQFESSIIVVEVKKTTTFDAGIGQVVSYMVGTQQQRRALENPKRIVLTVYGMVSDGCSWQFLRLDETKKLLVSPKLSLSFVQQAPQVYQFIDCIIRAAIAASPHTTPNNRFPSTNERWTQQVEAGIFGIPSGIQQQERQILGRPLSYYLVDVEIDDEDLEGVEEFLVVREGSPTPHNATVNGSSSSRSPSAH